MNDKQLQDNISKIIKARKILKDRIETSHLGDEMQQEEIKQFHKPIKELVESKALQVHDQLDALEQRQNLAIGQQDSLLKAIDTRDTRVSKMQSLGSKKRKLDYTITPEESWVQKLYKDNSGKHHRITQFEIDIKDNTLGELGKVDVDYLFNNNQLVITVEGEQLPINPDQVTTGLVALLLLPHKSIIEGHIEINPDDKKLYRDIMNTVGFRPSSADKYVKYIKPFTLKIPKTGTGLAMPSHTSCTFEGREHRMNLLAGSFRAGNTSNQIRQEMREILDHMLTVNEIPFTMHRKFYLKYNL